MSLVYISSPMAAETDEQEHENIIRGLRVCQECWTIGIPAVWVGALTAGMNGQLPRYRFMEMDLQVLDRCDAILMCDRWMGSEDCWEERAHARDKKIPIHYSMESLKSWWEGE